MWCHPWEIKPKGRCKQHEPDHNSRVNALVERERVTSNFYGFQDDYNQPAIPGSHVLLLIFDFNDHYKQAHSLFLQVLL